MRAPKEMPVNGAFVGENGLNCVQFFDVDLLRHGRPGIERGSITRRETDFTLVIIGVLKEP